MQRSRIFSTNQMNDVGLVFQLFQTHANILFVQRAKHFIVFVVELFGDEYSLIASERNGFGELCSVDIVYGSPRTINPMCSCFKNVVLEIMLVEQKDSFAC